MHFIVFCGTQMHYIKPSRQDKVCRVSYVAFCDLGKADLRLKVVHYYYTSFSEPAFTLLGIYPHFPTLPTIPSISKDTLKIQPACLLAFVTFSSFSHLLTLIDIHSKLIPCMYYLLNTNASDNKVCCWSSLSSCKAQLCDFFYPDWIFDENNAIPNWLGCY